MDNYLITILLLFVLWGIIFLLRKDVRKALVWGGGTYALLIIPLTFLVRTLGKEANAITIKDGFYMFMVGGFAATAYEIFAPHKIENTKKHHHIVSMFIFLASYCGIAFFLPWDPAWRFIASSAAGWLAIIMQRIDLFGASIAGAFAFLTAYIAGFLLYHMVVGEVAWSVKNLLTVAYPFPVKELLYALALGLMWTPLYEYMTGKSIR